jgi:phage tail-like protein
MRRTNVANSARNDPYKNFNFLIEIDGIAQAGFSECTGLRLEVDVIEYREGGERSSVRKLPGLAKVGDITLKRGVTISNELQAWFESVRNGVADRRNGAIVLLDDERKPVVRWKFFNAFPRRWEGPDLDAKGSEVAIETLTLSCEGLERE